MKNGLFRYFLAAFLLALASQASGQTPVLKHFSQIEGLPSNTVYEVAQSRSGFLWLATENGLCRYDGHTFERFQFEGIKDDIIIRVKAHGDTIGFLNLNRELVFIDQWGKILWIYSDPKTRVYDWAAREPSEIWIGYATKLVAETGVLRISADGRREDVEISPVVFIVSTFWLEPEKKNFMLVGTKGIHRFSKDEYGNIRDQSIPVPQDLYILRAALVDDKIYLVTRKAHDPRQRDNTLHVVEGDSLVLPVQLQGLPPSLIHSIEHNSQGRIFLNTSRGVFEVRERSRHSWKVAPFLLPEKATSHSFEDQEGNIWFTTLNHGLHKLLNSFPERYAPKSPQLTQDQYFTDLVAYSDSAVLSISSGAVLVHLQPGKSGPVQALPIPFPNLRGIFLTDQYYYLYGPSEMVRVDRKQPLDPQYFHHFFRHSREPMLYNIKSVAAGADKIWMGTHGDVLECLPHRDTCLPFFSNRAHALAFDAHQNGLWVGSEVGLYFYDLDTTVLYRDPSGQSLLGFINEMVILENGDLLVGTQRQGLWMVRNQQLEELVPPPRSNITSVVDLASDGEDAWVITNSGLFQVNLQSKRWSRLSYQLANPVALAFSGQSLWISGYDHIIRIPVSGNKHRSTPPQLIIESLEPFDQEGHPLPFQKELPATCERMEVSFAAITFSHEVTYQYRLNGRNWQALPDPRVSLASLTPGSYQIEIQGILDNGITSETQKINFSIAVPYWQSWWFRGLMVMGLLFFSVGAVIIFNRQRVRRIQQKQEKSSMQEQITHLRLQALRAQINPHFVFNSINAIQHLLLIDQEDEAMVYLADFAKLIRKAFESASDALVPLYSEIEFLELYLKLEKLRFKEKLDIEMRVDDQLDIDQLKIPGMAIQPFVENAFVHGLMHRPQGGRLQIEFTASQRKGLIKCTIEDNGVGRTKAAELGAWRSGHKSLGINITEERLRLTSRLLKKDRFDFEIQDLYDPSGTAQGTKVILYIPFST